MVGSKCSVLAYGTGITAIYAFRHVYTCTILLNVLMMFVDGFQFFFGRLGDNKLAQLSVTIVPNNLGIIYIIIED